MQLISLRSAPALVCAALALLGACQPALAKKNSTSSPTNGPAKKEPAATGPVKLWYRLAVTTDGQYRTLMTPPADREGDTLDLGNRWNARSRTAFVLFREDLTDPRTGRTVPGYTFRAGMAGELTSMNSTETWYRPTCTPEVGDARLTSATPVSGIVSGYLPADAVGASFDADGVRAPTANPPATPFTGVSTDSGYRCTNASGQVYTEVAPQPERPSGVYVPVTCGYERGLNNMRFSVKGKVRYGRAFTITVHCEAWWDDEDGAVNSRKTLDYRLLFTPCPKGGRTTRRC